MILSCSSVHLCVRPETLLTRYLAQYLTHFHQNYTNDAIWDRSERITIWVRRSQSRWNKVCRKLHFLRLSTRCLEKCQSEFHQTYINDVLLGRNECNKFWSQKVTVQGHGGITYAGDITVQTKAYSTRRLVSSKTFKFFYVYKKRKKKQA